MAIKLNNFVDININYNTTRNANYTRDTAVLIINGPEDKDKIYKSLDEVLEDFVTTESDTNDSRFEPEGDLRYYVEEFFNNGGAKLRIVQKETDEHSVKYIKYNANYFDSDESYYLKSGSTYTEVNPEDLNLYIEAGNDYIIPETFSNVIFYTLESEDPTVTPTEENFGSEPLYMFNDETKAWEYVEEFVSADVNKYKRIVPTEKSPVDLNLYKEVPTYNPIILKDLIEIVEGLGNEYIVICSNQNFNVMKNLNDKINKPENSQDNIRGIESKLIVTCIDAETYDDKGEETAIPEITSSYNGLVVKYGKLGSEMSIAAYLTNFNVFAANSVNDYDFTLEEIDYQYTVSGNEVNTVKGILVNEDILAKKLMKMNINFNGTLVNETRAIGGNDIRGNDFVNEFMLIVLHQTLTEQLVLLLTNKIKYNSTGLSLIGATISRELQKYVNNGYLTTDKIWDDEDLVYNGITIITKNTPLKIGYKYVVMPFATLSDEDRKNHKLPTIYILIADSYSIRKIEIEGTVF